MFSLNLKLLFGVLIMIFVLLLMLGFPHPHSSFVILFKCHQFGANLSSGTSNLQLDSEIPWPVISYPTNYGAEKHAVRRALNLTNPSCRLPTNLSATDVVRKIEGEGTVQAASLRYLRKRNGELADEPSQPTFGGTLGLEERKSYFHYEDGNAVSCGFLNQPNTGFIVSSEDREAMESCRGLVVISAIFGAYDKLRQPRHVRRITTQKVCFFMFVDNETIAWLANDYGIKADKFQKIGLWRIVLVNDLPYKEPVMNGIIPKHLPHRLFPNCVYSIWIDAKIQLIVDPLIILDGLLLSRNASLAISKHPYNMHTLEEAIFTVRWKKWDREAVLHQMEYYCAEGFQPWSPLKLPYSSDVPDSALILREHRLPTNLFSCLLFNELEAFNPRDQLAFAYIRDMMTPKLAIHMFDTDVFNAITVEYRHVLKKSTASNNFTVQKLQSPVSLVNNTKTACQSYLDRMWNLSSAH